MQPCAQLVRVFLAFGRILLQQVLDVDGQQNTVDGPARAALAQQRQEVVPGLGIDRAVRLLRGVASGGIDQHRFAGKPPVAIARAANTLYRAAGLALGQQKLQTGVLQGGGFSGAGCTDKNIPRQLVQGAGSSGPAFSPSGALELVDGFAKALVQHLALAVNRIRTAGNAL